MKNRIDELFKRKSSGILNLYCTAGYPRLDSTAEVLLALQNAGADMVELGMPYSDPIADGPVIQESNSTALENGMTLSLLLEQLKEARERVHLPVILMGYLNPVLQYGMEKFCTDAAASGADGVILPDLPLFEFEQEYRAVFQKHGLHFIFLVTPETETLRIREADRLGSGFLYAVSSSSTTGQPAGQKESVDAPIRLESYLKRLKELELQNPVLVGFGIKDGAEVRAAGLHCAGTVIGSAYITALKGTHDIKTATVNFLNGLKG
jgi:tryptophan synthase alpha chain